MPCVRARFKVKTHRRYRQIAAKIHRRQAEMPPKDGGSSLQESIRLRLAAKQREIQERVNAKKGLSSSTEPSPVNSVPRATTDNERSSSTVVSPTVGGAPSAAALAIRDQVRRKLQSQRAASLESQKSSSEDSNVSRSFGLSLPERMREDLKPHMISKAELKIVEPPDLNKGPMSTEMNPYFDPGLHGKRQRNFRFRKEFKFIEKGTLMERAAKLQRKAEAVEAAEKLKRQKEEEEEALNRKFDLARWENVDIPTPPNIEWWDLYLLNNCFTTDVDPTTSSYFDINSDFENVKDDSHSQDKMSVDDDFDLVADTRFVTDLIQHPVLLDSATVSDINVAPIPVMLTDKEKRRLRRQKRFELQKEKQDKIRLGLLPPEQPKVKRSNMMHVYGDEYIAEPSKIEALARGQEQARKEAHKKLVESTKLSAEERKEKLRRKLHEDVTDGVQVAVFRTLDLSHPHLQFKVTKNATQYEMSGVCLLCFEAFDFNLIIIEGGPKGVKKYKKLLLDRIKWDEALEEPFGLTEEASEKFNKAQEKMKMLGKPNQCSLIWEGTVKEPQFQGFRIKEISNADDVRKYLEIRGAAHYLDVAISTLKEPADLLDFTGIDDI